MLFIISWLSRGVQWRIPWQCDICRSIVFIQSSAVITRSIIVRYCNNNYRNWGRISIRCWIHKDTQLPALTSELWGVFCEYLWENWPRYNGTTLYIQIKKTEYILRRKTRYPFAYHCWQNSRPSSGYRKPMFLNTDIIYPAKWCSCYTYLARRQCEILPTASRHCKQSTGCAGTSCYQKHDDCKKRWCGDVPVDVIV